MEAGVAAAWHIPGLVSCLVVAALTTCGCVSVPRRDVSAATQLSSAARDTVGPPPVPAELMVPRFADHTERCALPRAAARFVSWLDYDDDLQPDLLVNGNTLFRNGGAPHFRFQDVTATAGLGEAKSGPVVCVDYDNDGWVDIVSTRGQLWRNAAGDGFDEVASSVGWQPHAKANVLGCGDVNNDGFADVYVGMGEDWNKGSNPAYYPHELWLNRSGRTFEEIGEAAGINVKRYGRGVLLSDVDGNGFLDIFVANYRLQPNLLWRNLGECRFVDVAQDMGVAGRKEPERFLDPVLKRRFGYHWGHTIGACWLDFDNDGRSDLFTANLVHKFVGATGKADFAYDIRGYVCDDSAIYRWNGARFEDWRRTLDVPLMPIGGRGVFRGDELWSGCVAADANNDAWTDVFVPQIYNLSYAKAKLLLNSGGTAFRDEAEAAGIQRIDTYAGAWADFDSDGTMDLATAGRSGRDEPVQLCLLRNEGCGNTDGTNWLKVHLEQGTCSHTLIGSAVTVFSDGFRLYQELSAGSSTYGQQNEATLHFGMGAARGPATVVIRWASGATSRHVTALRKALRVTAPGVALGHAASIRP